MNIPGNTLSLEQARGLINQMQDIAKDAQGKNLYAKIDAQGSVKLFTRSAGLELVNKLFNRLERSEQKARATQAILMALETRYPKNVASSMKALLGLDADLGIKLVKVRETKVDFLRIHSGFEISSLEFFAENNKLQLHQWHIAANDGLKNFVNLSGEDLMKMMALKERIPPTSLMAFQHFVEHSMKPAHEKSPNAGINKNEVLNFLAGWCAMSDAEKTALLANLSEVGQSALKSVDVLVKKMIAVKALPLSASAGFGLHRDLARKPGFDAIAGMVKSQLAQTASSNARQTGSSPMDHAAKALGKIIANQWSKPKDNSVDYISKRHELLKTMRSFADHHFDPATLGLPPEQRGVAAARWRACRENFVKAACDAALEQYYAGTVMMTSNGLVQVDSGSYPLAGMTLGEGGEGVITKLTNASDESVVVKSIKLDSDNKNSLLREAGVHQLASATGHKNVLKAFGCARDAQDNLSVFLEYAPYGDLDNYQKIFSVDKRSKLDSATAKKLQESDLFVFKSVLQGLVSVHDAGVIHRDLKPANIFIGENGTPKIADFGKAVGISESLSDGAPVHSPHWLAPELAAPNASHSVEASPASDVWAAAILMYQVSTGGKFPFPFERTGFNSDGIVMLTAFGADPDMKDFDKRFAKLELERVADKALAKILCDMLHPDPSQRPSASQVLALININGPSDDDAMGQRLIDMVSSR